MEAACGVGARPHPAAGRPAPGLPRAVRTPGGDGGLLSAQTLLGPRPHLESLSQLLLKTANSQVPWSHVTKARPDSSFTGRSLRSTAGTRRHAGGAGPRVAKAHGAGTWS